MTGFEGLGDSAPNLPAPEGLVLVDPRALEVFRAVDPARIAAVRRFQASSYVELGIHTTASINPADRTTDPVIEPPEIVAASTWLETFDNQGQIDGCIRLIEPPDGEPKNLPTIAKYEKQTGQDVHSNLPLPIAEISALARSLDSRSPVGFTRLILACNCVALERGYLYAVMGVVEPMAKLLRIMYGDEFLREIGDDSTYIDLPAADASAQQKQCYPQGGIRLTPFYYDLTASVRSAADYYQTRAGRFQKLQPVVQLLGHTLLWQEQHGYPPTGNVTEMH